MPPIRQDGTIDYSRGFPVYPVTRSWEGDHRRLTDDQNVQSGQPQFGGPAASSPNLSSSLTGSLPTFRAGMVQLPHGLRAKNAQGRTWGIDLASHLINTSEGLVSRSLMQEMNLGLQELGFVVFISSAHAARGHVTGSRHSAGLALDLNKLDSGSGFRLCSLDHPTLPTNPDAVKLVQWFIGHGYHPGTERGQLRCVLFGNHSFGWNLTGVNHYHHIHISHSRTLG